MTTIPAPLLDEILARAAASPRDEVCGLLFGRGNAIGAIAHTANLSPSPHDSFEVDPQALFAAMRAERGGGPRIVGHYHSHPNGSAVPSARDRAAAEAGRLWLIVGGGIARLWLATEDGFVEQRLERA